MGELHPTHPHLLHRRGLLGVINLPSLAILTQILYNTYMNTSPWIWDVYLLHYYFLILLIQSPTLVSRTKIIGLVTPD